MTDQEIKQDVHDRMARDEYDGYYDDHPRGYDS